jgi:hypothetical protein
MNTFHTAQPNNPLTLRGRTAALALALAAGAWRCAYMVA